MLAIIKKIAWSTKNALAGVKSAFEHDESIKLEGTIGAAAYLIIAGLLWPLSGSQLALLIGSYLLIIITELVNTSIEVLLERLHPVRHHLIGAGKDIAAASVLFAYIIAGTIVLLITLDKYGVLLW